MCKFHHTKVLGLVRGKNLVHSIFYIFGESLAKVDRKVVIAQSSFINRTPLTFLGSLVSKISISLPLFFLKYVDFINPFSTNVPLLYPLKTSDNRKVF